jgi:uracil-DNA glycosylase
MSRKRLLAVHQELAACHACSGVVGPSVYGPPVLARVMLVGQAPGVHEAGIGRPFAWTAGRTLFRWFENVLGLDEKTFRENVYFTAVARCFPGKAKSGGDRRPDRDEIEACRPFLAREVEILRPQLILAVGTLAITQVLGDRVAGMKLDQIIGTMHRVRWHGVTADVIPLPHPSGASPWPKIEPGKTLLAEAMQLVRAHPAMHIATGWP